MKQVCCDLCKAPCSPGPFKWEELFSHQGQKIKIQMGVSIPGAEEQNIFDVGDVCVSCGTIAIIRLIEKTQGNKGLVTGTGDGVKL